MESAKSGLTVALGVYPIFVGLYATGFFWNVPKDALGGLSFSDFILKASIIYASFSAFIIAYFLAAYSALIFIEPSFAKSDAEKAPAEERIWDRYEKSDRIRHVVTCFLLISLFAFAFWLDPPSISFDPALFICGLFFLFFCGKITRPFVTNLQWKAASILFFSSCVIIAPIYAGFIDSEPSPEDPTLQNGQEKCPVILIGSASAIIQCATGYALVPKEKFPNFFYWKNKRR